MRTWTGTRIALAVSLAVNVAFVGGFVGARLLGQERFDESRWSPSPGNGGIFSQHPDDYDRVSRQVAAELGLNEDQRVVLASNWHESTLRGQEIQQALDEVRIQWWEQMSEPKPDRSVMSELETQMGELMREHRILRADRFRAFVESLEPDQRERVMERMRQGAFRMDQHQRTHRGASEGDPRPRFGRDDRRGTETRPPGREMRGDGERPAPRDERFRHRPDATPGFMQPPPPRWQDMTDEQRREARQRFAEMRRHAEGERKSELFRQLEKDERWPGHRIEGPRGRPDRPRPDVDRRDRRPEGKPVEPDHDEGPTD
ncbi:MAG: periplasmic heavy metal sensor [Phycisphaeraceae bacterium]|nr:periplasmic heavy metal sensor [Phycisphaeraceae bacterium]